MKKKNFDPSSGLLEMHFSMHEVEVCNHVIKNSHWLIIIEYSRASHNAAFVPLKMQSCANQRCSVFQLCASYFISVNPRFQYCAIHFISINPRFQHEQVFFISANTKFSAVQELSGFFGHQHYTEVGAVRGSVVQGSVVLMI